MKTGNKLTSTGKMRHECHLNTNGVGWAHCTSCDGRIHMEGCTAKRNKWKDCCKERHNLLMKLGFERGLCDSSIAMSDAYGPLEKENEPKKNK